MLESKGKRQANINIVDGKKSFVILESEVIMVDQVNQTQGEAKTILAGAEATSKRIKKFFKAIQAKGSSNSTSLHIV